MIHPTTEKWWRIPGTPVRRIVDGKAGHVFDIRHELAKDDLVAVRHDSGIVYWERVSEWLPTEPEKFTSKRPEYNGEGLPPVGSVCEVYHCDEWLQGEVIAHFQQHAGAVAAYTVEVGSVGSGIKHLDSAIAECFRPLRTPEQIAADEREYSIRNACTAIARTLDQFRGDIACGNAARAVIEALHDAGYRKTTE